MGVSSSRWGRGMDAGHERGTTVLEEIWLVAQASLDERAADIVAARNGVPGGVVIRLEALGQRYRVTRERVRQIEQDAYRQLRAKLAGQLVRQTLRQLEQAGIAARGLITHAEALRILAPDHSPATAVDPAARAHLRFVLQLTDDYRPIARTPWILACGVLDDATVRALPDLYLALRDAPIQAASGPDAARKAALVQHSAFAELSASDVGLVVDALLRMPGPTMGPVPEPVAVPTARRVRRPRGGTLPIGHAAHQDGQLDDYERWNQAIIEHVIAAAMPGDPVYLSIDQATTAEIREHVEQRSDAPITDLVTAVRQRVLAGDTFRLRRVAGADRTGRPLGVAFLATMVMAAAQMGGDDARNIAAKDYFTHFRALFALPPAGGGRPDGLCDEEALWLAWNTWLHEQGFVSSARAGEGAQRYINYPISQALLRGTDRDRLVKIFADSNWAADTDAGTLVALVRRQHAKLTVHLGELVSDTSPRARAIADVIHAVFAAHSDRQIDNRERRRGSFAGLVRSETLLGETSYAVMPRMPRHGSFAARHVLVRGTAVALHTGRRGWYQPIGNVTAAELDTGTEYPLDGISRDVIRLPMRDYWICVPDPEAPEIGDWGSWGHASLGEPFLILCRDSVREDLYRLRDERLLEWTIERPLENYPGWHEFDGCLVISSLWDAVKLADPTLQEALRPQERTSIILSGGIRLGGQRWLASHGPQISVAAFDGQTELTIAAADRSHVISTRQVPTNQPITHAWQRAGVYRVSANTHGTITERIIEIIDIDGLRMATHVPALWRDLPGARLAGAWVSLGAAE